MDSKYKYRVEIQQMMFVSGATSDPPLQTVIVVEDIVRAQVVELINRGIALARKRGARSLSVEDVMFLIRHDTAKVNRLSTYLAWKDVRKNARDQDSGAAGGADAPDIMEDPSTMLTAQANQRGQKSKRIGLPWKPANMFAIPMTAVAPSGSTSHSSAVAAVSTGTSSTGAADIEVGDDADAVGESDDEDNEGTQIMNERLRSADLRTRNMTREEYVHWSECRQASFTFRKAKRFKEWAGIAHITDSRLQDDIMDVMGFLTFEIVANLTGAALKVKSRWESRHKRQQDENGGPGPGADGSSAPGAAGTTGSGVTGASNPPDGSSAPSASAGESKQSGSLFKMRTTQETPLMPAHIRAAYEQFETLTDRQKALRQWRGGRLRHETKLI